jgi:hypothetical protein
MPSGDETPAPPGFKVRPLLMPGVWITRSRATVVALLRVLPRKRNGRARSTLMSVSGFMGRSLCSCGGASPLKAGG